MTHQSVGLMSSVQQIAHTTAGARRGLAGEQVFDLFYDVVTLLWVLDVAHK